MEQNVRGLGIALDRELFRQWNVVVRGGDGRCGQRARGNNSQVDVEERADDMDGGGAVRTLGYRWQCC
jgi:hypothetical protein